MKNRQHPQGSGGFFVEKELFQQKFSAKHSFFFEVNSHLNQQKIAPSALDFKPFTGLSFMRRVGRYFGIFCWI
jgi:hypothetical protein